MKTPEHKKNTFSKKLTIIDTISWTLLVLILMAVMLFVPAIANYVVNFATTITAAYVSLRLGYTGKAAMENYKKISATVRDLSDGQSG